VSNCLGDNQAVLLNHAEGWSDEKHDEEPVQFLCDPEGVRQA